MKRRQTGVVLLIALIALVAVTLAGIALMRSVDTGLLIAGNLSFRQAAVAAADGAIEQAIEQLATLDQDALGSDGAIAGYYANRYDSCDITGSFTPTEANDDVQWNPNGAPLPNCNMIAAAVAADRMPSGYEASYVINRMCDASLPQRQTNCSLFNESGSGGGTSSSMDSVAYGTQLPTGEGRPYYRITVRVTGPRSTVAFVQGALVF